MTKKSDLLAEASELKLNVSAKNTIAEIEAAIKQAGTPVEKAVAKSGKRSTKGIKEAEEKQAKKDRKTSKVSDVEKTETVKKGPKPVTRPLIERRSKKYQELSKLFDKSKFYNISEAVELATKTSPSKFDASVEIHVRLNVDPRHADQNIRSTVSLPHGSGKTIRVAVFAPETDHKDAKSAGADIVGDEALLKQLDKEEVNFDVLITSPQYMPKLGKYARLLGPRGLMPNPKSGTVATNIAKAVKEAKAGKVEYRVDKQSIVHIAVGKVSFGSTKLLDNSKAFFDSLQSQKPSSIKGAYIKSISMSTTMGPGIKVELF